MKKLIFRGITLAGVLFVVLILLAVILGATGFSDKMLGSVINEELRGLRIGLAQTIRDPAELENVLSIKEQELMSLHGLDRPWYHRLPNTILKVVRLDLGEAKTIRSFEGSNKISDIVLERLPNTVMLMTTATLIVAIIGIMLGAWLATRPGTRIDRALSIFSAASYALPSWWLGIILILIFAIKFSVFPSGGMYSTPPPIETLPRFLDLLKHAILPVITLVLVSLGPYLYTIRTVTLNVAQEDFVVHARARGLSEARIRWRYILRVAAPPIITGFVLGLAGSFAGAILTETVFNWPGMGRLYYEAILGTPDEGLIIALTFLFTLIYVTARFLLEILYLGLDPRIRY